MYQIARIWWNAKQKTNNFRAENRYLLYLVYSVLCRDIADSEYVEENSYWTNIPTDSIIIYRANQSVDIKRMRR